MSKKSVLESVAEQVIPPEALPLFRRLADSSDLGRAEKMVQKYIENSGKSEEEKSGYRRALADVVGA
ncbi:MAG: hypothetical protein ACREGR_02520 [Minisyncoccia bacterium]